MSHLATSWTPLAVCPALHLVLIAEEVRVALVTEGQAQNSFGVCHRVALAVSHLAVTMPRHVTTRKSIKHHVSLHGLLSVVYSNGADVTGFSMIQCTLATNANMVIDSNSSTHDTIAIQSRIPHACQDCYTCRRGWVLLKLVSLLLRSSWT